MINIKNCVLYPYYFSKEKLHVLIYRSWDDFFDARVKALEQAKEKLDRSLEQQPPHFLIKQQQNKIEEIMNKTEEENRMFNTIIPLIMEKFGFNLDTAMEFFSPYSAIFKLTYNQAKNKIDILNDYFKDFDLIKKLILITENPYLVSGKYLFPDLKSIWEFDEQNDLGALIGEISALFTVSHNEILDLFANVDTFLFMCLCKRDYLVEKIGKFCKLLQISKEKFIEMFKSYPYIIERSLYKLKNNINSFAAKCNCTNLEIIQLMIKYPPLIFWNSTYLQFSYKNRNGYNFRWGVMNLEENVISMIDEELKQID